MGRARGAGFVVLALVFGACSGGHSGSNGSKTPPVTAASTGPLAPALVTEAQLRQVPGLSTATVTSLDETRFFVDPDPRGPCGAKVPVVSLNDAAGEAIKAEGTRGGAELVTRLPAGAAKNYLDARMADAKSGCAEYETTTNQGVKQRIVLARIVRLHPEFQQALAVVTAVKIGASVRAQTQIEVRYDDILAKMVLFSDTPLDDLTVRGVASVMGRDLAALSS